MESKWTLHTADNHIIYGIKSHGSTPSTKAIFIIHGYACSANDYALKRAADHFYKDFDVYRFNLYDGQDGGRSIENCIFHTYVDDLNLVLENFSPAYDQVFLIGHSYGGTIIMMTNPENITAVSLWDPSFNLKGLQADFKSGYEDCGDVYKLKGGVTTLMSKEMYNLGTQMDENVCIELAKNFSSPVQVLTAENAYYNDKPLSYNSFGNPNNIREFIENADHNFFDGNSCDDLLNKTEKWFKQYAT